jgi:hypothetical protein
MDHTEVFYHTNHAPNMLFLCPGPTRICGRTREKIGLHGWLYKYRPRDAFNLVLFRFGKHYKYSTLYLIVIHYSLNAPLRPLVSMVTMYWLRVSFCPGIVLKDLGSSCTNARPVCCDVLCIWRAGRGWYRLDLLTGQIKDVHWIERCNKQWMSWYCSRYR